MTDFFNIFKNSAATSIWTQFSIQLSKKNPDPQKGNDQKQ